ncbi:MAG: alpha-glucosidase, partial [Actinomycetota bacterium]|nr:alpha-glucosidase [Actinomycetota bacterium]
MIYQIYPRSWADSDGDGVGDLPGITARLPYLRDLGVDAVWLSPFYVSPQADAGYDVADYRDIDPIFGTLSDADTLLATAHDLGLKVIVDLVPNHSSDEHPWFRAALAADPGSTERDRYIFRNGRGPGGSLPPNNWLSIFGGSAWTRVDDGQWYLHLFAAKQPDFNWENPQVRAEFEDVLKFWLDRGVDGFRVDVAHGLVKQSGLPDWEGSPRLLGDGDTIDHERSGERAPMWDQDGVHEIYRRWRQILGSYNPVATPGYSSDNDRILCAEAWVDSEQRAARYVRADEMHQAFNFDFLQTQWRASDLREAITRSFAETDAVGATTTWVLSNHDVVRHSSRLGLPVGTTRPNGIGIGDPQPDATLGLRRARAATALMLALPGSSYIYQGEELGLPESTDMPDDVRQDPTWSRSGHTERGRDGARVPMPWEGDRPSYGFG